MRKREFSPTAEELEQLQVYETPIGPRAVNVALWDTLTSRSSRRPRSRSKGAAAKGKDKKALTPAEQKKSDREKAKKAEDQLNRFTNDWLRRLIRCTLATTATEVQRMATLPCFARSVIPMCPRFRTLLSRAGRHNSTG